MTEPTFAADTDHTVRQAHHACDAARDVDPRTRAGWLIALADALDAAAGELIAIAQEETHLTEERLTGELKRTTFQLRLFAQEVERGRPIGATIDHADQTWGMGPRPDLRRMNVPLGVVGVFGASNFPFAFSVMGGDTVSALAAGCAVVHKIHDAHEHLGQRTAEVAIRALAGAGAPGGLFATVSGHAAGKSLIDHPLTKAIAFTGSTHVGRMLMDRAAARPEPIPFYGELGSINPVFVTEAAWAARKDEILSGYVNSYTLGMGQFCTKPGLLFVPVLDASAKAALGAAVAGATAAPMLSPDLADGYRRTRDDMLQRHGIDVLVPGGEGQAPAPTLLLADAQAALDDHTILTTELFGPASIVVQYHDVAQLVQMAEAMRGQLTATLHAQPEDDVHPLVAAVQARAGRLVWNSWPTGVTVTYAQQHGGPYPATTASGTTSVGTASVHRFVRPVAFQDFPDAQLPAALQEGNPWGIRLRVDGRWQPETSQTETASHTAGANLASSTANTTAMHLPTAKTTSGRPARA